MPALAPGDPAPNFDLSSTEDVLLMLRDEVPRTAIVLYFFDDPADSRVREDLTFLGQRYAGLKEVTASILGVSPAKLDALKALQRELGLRFPLLTDDRAFSRLYGLEPPAAEGGEGAEAPAAARSMTPAALYVVDRRQVVCWAGVPAPPIAGAWPEILGVLKRLGSSTSNYPRRITNRLVDLWVNQTGGLRKKRA
jgi:peroxiredoxin